MKHALLALLFVFAVAACGDDPADEPSSDPGPEKPGDPTPKEVIVITPDHSSPAGLAQSIFEIVGNGNLDALAGVAAPGADGDSKRLAAVAKASEKDREEFTSYFLKAKVTGPAKVNGDRAEVPILFGPGGDKKETFNMVRIDGKWYLESF